VHAPGAVERTQCWPTRIDATIGLAHDAVAALPAGNEIYGKWTGIAIDHQRPDAGG
jgi:hypothetical protein